MGTSMKLTNKDILKITFRTYLLRVFYNYKYLFGQGFCYCVNPFVEKLNKSQAEEFIKRHNRFFNTNEYMVGFAIGAVLRLEDEKEIDKAEIVKKAYCSTLGALGDNLEFKLLKPFLILILCTYLFFNGFKVDEPFIYLSIGLLFLFNGFNFFLRFKGIKNGYLKKTAALTEFKKHYFDKTEKGVSLLKEILLGVSVGFCIGYLFKNCDINHILVLLIPIFFIYLMNRRGFSHIFIGISVIITAIIYIIYTLQ